MTTKVHLVAGHLGAGKTSVLRHLLAGRPAGERVGLVVNDFGEARVDDAVLSSLVAETREIRGACVCCTAPDGFAAAVASLLPKVDRLFVEPTGLARPADLVDTLRRAPFAASIELRPLIVVVDPEVAADPHAHEVHEGLSVAEVVVVNRVDRASPAALDALRRRLDEAWPGPRLRVETTFGVVGDEVLSPSDWRSRSATPHDHDHDHDAHAVTAWSTVRPASVVWRRDGVEALVRDPLWVRAKGLVHTDEGWLEVQRAGGEVTLRPTAWRADTRVDWLAPSTRRAEAERLLAGLDDLVAPAHGDGLQVVVPGGGRTFDARALAELPGVDDAGARFPGRSGRAASLEAVLRAAGAGEGGTVVVAARDGYVSAPADRAAVVDGLVVFALGDGPLPDTQGGPLRLLVPGPVGCANVKAVVGIVWRR